MKGNMTDWAFLITNGLLLWTLATGSNDTYPSPCSNDQFFCQNGDTTNPCVPLDWVCDNVKDCSNGKDEANCRYATSCPDGYLVCLNFACVDASLKCDGFDDCLDGSDERSCETAISTEHGPNNYRPHSVLTTVCPLSMYQCRRGPCISLDALCDAYQDCPEMDDEEQCHSGQRNNVCDESHFTCKSDGVCVPLSWVCDEMSDCIDQSDEQYCLDGQMLPGRHDYYQQLTAGIVSNCTRDQFTCDGNSVRECIPLANLCNGRPDCPEGDDEGGFCGQCAHFGCAGVCIDSPLGAFCRCGEGLALAADAKSCLDVNECESGGHNCWHFCENSHGHFRCTCAPGYTLDASDGVSCRLQRPDVGQLFVSFGHEVRTIPTNKHSAHSVPYGPLMENSEMLGGIIHGLDHSSVDGHLYMAVSSVGGRHGAIHAFKNEQICMVDYVPGISNVAIDWLTANIYYTSGSPSQRPGVGVCRMDGRFCHLLINDRNMHRFRGLALHPRRGLMFWSDWGEKGPRIEQASMDGQNRSTLTDIKLDWPNGLTFDYIHEHLYFADAQLKSIDRIDIFTKQRLTVTTKGVHHPFDLVVFNGRVFWSDWNIEAVVVTELYNVSDRHIVHSLPQVPYGLAISHPSYHQMTSDQPNPCSVASCSHMCLLSGVVDSDSYPTATCVCPDQYESIGDGRCSPINSTERRKRGLDMAPEICKSLMSAYCEANLGCQNNGTCSMVMSMGGKMSAITCRCPRGYIGHYCEVKTLSEHVERFKSASGFPLLTVFVLLTISCLAVAVAYCCMRKSALDTRALRKATLRSISRYGPIIRFTANSRGNPNSDIRPILSTTKSSSAPHQQFQQYNTTANESFSNPLYEDIGVYAPTTGIYEQVPVFDQSIHHGTSLGHNDTDSGLGSGNLVCA